MFLCICLTYKSRRRNQKTKFLFTIQISTLLKKNSTAGKKSTEPEDEESKADGTKEKGEGDADVTTESSTKKSTKPATVKSTETNETTDASVKDESDADENIDDEKKGEVDNKIKVGYKSMQKSYIKLVCIHCNCKCVTFKVNNHKQSIRFVQQKKIFIWL